MASFCTIQKNELSISFLYKQVNILLCDSMKWSCWFPFYANENDGTTVCSVHAHRWFWYIEIVSRLGTWIMLLLWSYPTINLSAIPASSKEGQRAWWGSAASSNLDSRSQLQLAYTKWVGGVHFSLITLPPFQCCLNQVHLMCDTSDPFYFLVIWVSDPYWKSRSSESDSNLL